MRTGILKDDLYSEYKQEWYSESDPKMGFGLSDLQIQKLKQKYKLWRHLHPTMERPENRCLICRERSGRSCPPVRLGFVAVGDEKELSFQQVSEEMKTKGVHVVGYCMEWVKYV